MTNPAVVPHSPTARRAHRDWRNHRTGHLTILRLKRSQQGKQDPRWTCLCDCGLFVDVRFSHLQSGRRTTCGSVDRHKLSGR